MSISRTGEKNYRFGKKNSEETRKKMSAALKGRVTSEETRKKLSEAMSGENNPCFGRTGEKHPMFGRMGEKHPMFGKKFTEEMKVNLLKNIPRGEQHNYWKGDNVGYHALHKWVRKKIPKPSFCEICHTKEPCDLANISGKYSRELSDWEWLCRMCHQIKDGRREKLIAMNRSRRVIKSSPEAIREGIWMVGGV
jgi:hypothetical protein